MFPARYFNVRYWAARYWPKVGATVVVIGATPAERLGIIPAEVRSIVIEDEVRRVPVVPEVRLVTL